VTSPLAARFGLLTAAVVAATGVGLALPGSAAATIEPFIPSLVPAATSATPAATYHAVTGFTAYASNGRVAPGNWVSVPLAGRHGLPAAGGFTAAAVTVTLSQATKPTTAAVSGSSTATRTRVVTAPVSRAAAGFAVAPVGSTGAVRVRLSGGHAALRIVVAGYQRAGNGGATFHPLTPATVLAPVRVGAGATRSVSILGSPRTGLPPNGHVAAVALAVTAGQPSATTTVTAYPRGQAAGAGQAVLAARNGRATSAVGIVAVGAHGDVTLRNAHGHAMLSAQVEGYWTKDPTGASFRSVAPEVVYGGSTAANAWRSVTVADRSGLPQASQIGAALLSITAEGASVPAYLAIAPTRRGFPSSGPISVPAHTSVTTSVLARLSGANIHIYANRRLSLTVSVVGWYGTTANGTDVNASAGSCSSPLSSDATFAVIRATNGQPFHSANPTCFSSETNEARQLPAAPQYYLNLADPGRASKSHWDHGGPTACHVAHDYDLGCAYDYGYLAAKHAVGFAKQHEMAAGSRWWLDVEIGNSWGSRHLKQPGHQAANAADIQGALHYLRSQGLPAGVYTETVWWDAITGSPRGFSRVPVWGGGAGSLANARANCKQVSITGGPALLAQWFTKDSFVDHDVAC
jgi:hypothetical protein